MCSSGYTRCQADHYYYFIYFDNSYIILLLYVADMLIIRPNIEEINYLKRQFAMQDLGVAKQIFGIRIIKDSPMYVKTFTSRIYG